MGYESITDSASDDTKLPLAGGAMTGAITTNSTFDGRDVAADGVTADAALPKAGGAMTGAITTNSTFDGVDIATRDGILTSTTTTAGAALPKAGGTMTGNITMGDNQIIIDSTVADGTVSGVVTTGNIGASMVVGDVIYLNSADDEWHPTDADATASAIGMIGISLTAASSGNVNILLKGFAMISGIFEFSTAGAPLYLSTTPGDMSQTAPSGSGDVVRVVGYAHDDNDTIYFNPDNTWVEIA